MAWHGTGAVAALLVALAIPAGAQAGDGFDNDGDGLIDEPYEETNGAPQPGGLEAECIATARPEICLAYFELSCQSYGFPLACALTEIGHGCQRGDGRACGYFEDFVRANSACAFGDQASCGWLTQQPLPR